MHLWKQSTIARCLRAGMVMAALWMPGTNHVWADEVQDGFMVNDDTNSLPTLLLESRSEAFLLPTFRLQEIHQHINETQSLTDQVKGKKVKHALERAIGKAKDLHKRAKAQTLTKAYVDKALASIDRSAQKYGLDQKKDKEACHALIGLSEKIRSSCRELLTEIASLHVSSEPIAISALPYTITQSGNYYLDSDLELTDPTAQGAAITVTADDVHLDLGDHGITVSPTITAIFVRDASNVSVYNGRLVTPTESDNANSVGILMDRVDRAVFDNIVFLNTKGGALSTHSQDLTFINCRFTHPYATWGDGGRGIVASNGTRGLHVEDCVFGLIGSVGIFLNSNEVGMEAETTSAQIRNCKFLSSDGATNEMSGSAIYLASRKDALPISNVEISDCEFHDINCTVGLEGVAGVEIRHCTFTDYGNGVRIYGGHDVSVHDCSFTREWQTPFSAIDLMPFPRPIKNIKIQDCTCTCNGRSALEIRGGYDNTPSPPITSDVLVENCVFNSIGAPGTISVYEVSDLVVRDSILRNTKEKDTRASIQLRSGNAVVDNCLLTGFVGCRLSGTTNCEIKNCTITDSVVGIILNEGATNTSIRNNTIFGNDADGIFVEASSNFNTIIGNNVTDNGANGIFVTSSPNTVRGNTVSQNGSDGLLNTGGVANAFLENASCNNGGADCTGIPAAIALPPGSPAVVGGNICCQ